MNCHKVSHELMNIHGMSRKKCFECGEEYYVDQDKWEMYLDPAYYETWAVREKDGDRSFNSPRLFHFATKADAVEFKAIVEKSL